jgi:hypothetical protein
MKCPLCQFEFSPVAVVASVPNLSGQVFLEARCQNCQGLVECFVTPPWEVAGVQNPETRRVLTRRRD